MDIRFVAHGASGRGVPERLADHARLRLRFRLRHRSETVAHLSVRLGETRSDQDGQRAYCVMQVQLRDAPAATVVEIGADAYGTIDRATDRIAQLVEEMLSVADALRLPSIRSIAERPSLAPHSFTR